MKRGLIILLICMLFVLPIVSAQTYSGFNRFTDNAKMTFSSGDNKMRVALDIRTKEVNSAIENSLNQNEKAAIENLERAHEKLQFVREKMSLDIVDNVKDSVDEITDKIDEEDLSENFDVYALEEEKTWLTAKFTREIFEWCKELAREDYTAMLREEECNPDTAPPGLEKELKELKKLQEELFVKLMLDIRSCIDDPGTCNCEDVSDNAEREKCGKMISLAIKCEYKDDQEACSKIKSLQPPAESFVPDFLRDLFRKKSYMIDYNIKKSDVPPECYNENTKPECEQYRHLKEISAKCWDREGNWDDEECGGPSEETITMQESIPECYDENDNFLEECGEIIMVTNENGLINYIIGGKLDNIIDEFDVIEDFVIEDGESTIEGDKVWEIKEEINTIDGEIQNWVVDHPVMDVDSDDGLTWEIKTDVDGTDSGGDAVVTIAGDNQGVVTNDDEAPGPQGIIGDGGMAPGTTDDGLPIDSGDGDCGEGVACGGEDDVIDSPAGDDGIDNGATLDDTDASDDSPNDVVEGDSSSSNSEGNSAPITGEVINSEETKSFFRRIFDFIF